MGQVYQVPQVPLSMIKAVPQHKVKILFGTGQEQEFEVRISEFGSHPEYFELMMLDNSISQIPTHFIKGISYHKTYLV